MVKWDRRQFLSGLLATVSAQTASTALAAAPSGAALALPVASPTPAVGPRVPVPPAPRAPTPPALPTAAPRAAHHAGEGGAHGLRAILRPGLRLGRWRIVAVYGIKYGAIPVILEGPGGARFQVDVLRRERHLLGRPGIAETRYYGLYLANGGRGRTPTRESQGLGVLALAALLRAREDRVPRPDLLTLRDRLGSFPEGTFNSFSGRG